VVVFCLRRRCRGRRGIGAGTGGWDIGAIPYDPGYAPAVPTSFCQSKPNSLGCEPTIGFSGSPSVTGGVFDVTCDQTLNNKLGGHAGLGNQSGDPRFWAPLGSATGVGHDFHLQAGSPCIDAGDPSSPLDPDGSIADIGVFPFDAAWCPESFSTTYCTPGYSASGCQAAIPACGLSSASLPSGFVLHVTGVEGSKQGLFFWGPNGRQAQAWGNGTSYQCVVPPVKRGELLSAVGTQGACDAAYAYDLNARWTAKPNQNPGASAVTQAQFWYRDPFNTSNQATSLSDAVEFPVGP